MFFRCTGGQVPVCKTGAVAPTASRSAPAVKAAPEDNREVATSDATKAAGKPPPPRASYEEIRALFRSAYERFGGEPDAERQAFAAAAAGLGASLPVIRNGPVGYWGDRNTALSDDGGRLLLTAFDSGLVADTTSGDPLGFFIRESLNDAAMTSDGRFVVHADTGGLFIRRLPSMKVVARIETREDAPFALLDRRRLVTSRVPADALDPEELIVVDIATGRVTRVLDLKSRPAIGPKERFTVLPRAWDADFRGNFGGSPPTEGPQVKSLAVLPDVVAAVWEDGAVTLHRVSNRRLLGSFHPSFTADYRHRVVLHPKPPRAAVATALPPEGEPDYEGTVLLIDLKKNRVIEALHRCDFVADLAFSGDGRVLAVGDLLEACFHDGRTGRLRSVSQKVREAFEFEDDLMNVILTPVSPTHWLLSTADGATVTARWRDGKVRWLGYGRELVDDGVLYFARDDGEDAALLTVTGDQIVERPLREAERNGLPTHLWPEAMNTKAAAMQRVIDRVAACDIEGYFIPDKYCVDAPPKTPPQAVDEGARGL